MQPPEPIDPTPPEEPPAPPLPDPAAMRRVLLWAGGIMYLLMYIGAVIGNHHVLPQPIAFVEVADGFTAEAMKTDGYGGLVGICAGLLAVGLMRVPLVSNLPWMLEIRDELARMIGRCDVREAFLLALFSSIAEEALFRGVLQNLWGIWIAAAIFGCVHFYGRRLWYYPLLAFGMGLLFGGLYQWTDALAAPIACHFLINFLNLMAIGEHAAELGLN